MNEFLNTLFDDGEYVCAAYIPYETGTIVLGEINEDMAYITLNPLRGGTARSDGNTTLFRNILLEFDDLGLVDQRDLVKRIGLPYSTCVFSGNKSLHFVISLEEPLEGRKEYDHLVRWIYAAVPEADQACKNPSRFTRLGGGRHASGASQKVLKIRSRVSVAELTTWLRTRCEEPVYTNRCTKQMGNEDYLQVQGIGYRARLHPATVGFAKTGGRVGHRHKNIFIAACNMRDCYYTLDEAKFLLLRVIKGIYEKQGKLDDLDLKERAVEDAFALEPRTQTK